MEVISLIALVLLSMVGYSSGVVGKAGKKVEVKPKYYDLVLLLTIWAGSIYSALAFDINRWQLILIWVIASIIMGILSVWPRDLSDSIVSVREKSSTGFLKKPWVIWTNFSVRMGSFQSGLGLSFFFFIVVVPIALMVRVFSDPLRIKHKGNEQSHWLLRQKKEVDIEQLRRQF